MADRPSGELLEAIQQRLQVSENVACDLILDYKMFFHSKNLGAHVQGIYGGPDPAKQFMNKTMWKYIHKAMREDISRLENRIVKYHLGLELPKAREAEVMEDPELRDWLTFEELSIYLNNNDHSGAEKRYDQAIRKLRHALLDDDSEYALWLEMWRALQHARSHPPIEIPPGYLPPVPWWDTDETEDTSEYN